MRPLRRAFTKFKWIVLARKDAQMRIGFNLAKYANILLKNWRKGYRTKVNDVKILRPKSSSNVIDTIIYILNFLFRFSVPFLA